MKLTKIIQDLVSEAPDCMRGTEFTSQDAIYVRNLVKMGIPYVEALQNCFRGINYTIDLKVA